MTFEPADREIQVECWPRYANPSDGPEGQYEGWPITVTQVDGDGREAAAHLTRLDIQGLDEPVVQVIDEVDDEPLYTFRLEEPTFRPPVFREDGSYTVRLGDGERWLKTLDGLQPLSPDEQQTRSIDLFTG